MSNLTRRNFLSASAVTIAGLSAATDAPAGKDSLLRAPSKVAGSHRDWAKIRGFNYQPSYGRTGFELWQEFDAKIIETELARGKKYFPQMNALRWWQSWD